MSLLTAFALLVILLTVLYWYISRKFNYWKNLGVPYEKPLQLLGNLLDVALGRISIGKKFENLYHKYDTRYFGIYVLDKPFLVLKDPDIIKRILIKEFNVFPNRCFAVDEKADSIFSNSLFAIPTPHWRTVRSKLTPLFTSGKMKNMFPLIQECGDELQKYLGTVLGKDLEMKEICAKYTTDVITSCAFGIKANSFASENSEFRVVGRKIFDLNFIRFLHVFCYLFATKLVTIFRLKFIEPTGASFLCGVFWETIREREATKIKRNDLIDMLIELKSQKGSTEEFQFYGDRLVSQAVIFFTAGHETSSTAIAFTLYELCINHDLQTRLRNEIKTVIEKHGGVTYEAVNEMKYLHMVVSETLRKYPLIPILSRCGLQNYTIPETGLTIEKGVPVIIPQFGLNSDPKYFPEPTKYDPERFNEENKNKIPSGVFLPFGDGPRNCIGERFGLMITKLGIIYIIKDFLVEKSSTTPVPLVLKARSTVTISKVGIPMLVQKL